MSGRILGGTPWTREAIHCADPRSIERVEAAIPDGHHITLICGGRPRPLGAILVHGVGNPLIRVEPAYYSVGAACEAVLRRFREEAA